jgi:hypothetical protein
VPKSQIPIDIDYWLSLGVGFEPAPSNAWILYFDGLIPIPDGRSSFLGASFLIYFEEDRAKFSYYVPIIDAVPSIAAASAVLIPEPSVLLLGSLMLCWLCATRSWNGLTSRRREILGDA